MLPPSTRQDMDRLGWNCLDVILVSGDAHIDTPYMGTAVIARLLLDAGFKVGVISQPDIHSGADITRLGEPSLFWGVSGGSVDSMVANYTPLGKRRHLDDYTPGGENTKRPDRAVIVYSQLIRTHFKQTVPIVLGGIEASLRRISHYDYWSDTVRRSILFDAKADFLLYGMADASVLALARSLASKGDPRGLAGLCYISKEIPAGYLELPAHDQAARDKELFMTMFRRFYAETDSLSARGLFQKQDTRYLIQNPPAPPLSQAELDRVHALPFTHCLHPYDRQFGEVKALETIHSSITTHRGCYGECHFCAIGVHQGRTVQWRSESSILKEAQYLAELPEFKGTIQDVGGPTANMYGFECPKKLKQGICRHRKCLFPEICPNLPVTHLPQTRLLEKIREIPKVKKAFVRSGIRYDLLMADSRHGESYLSELAAHHVSGQLKVAPEHSDKDVLRHMGKQKIDTLLEFKRRFDLASQKAGKKQFLTYYFIAAHPGCDLSQMKEARGFCEKHLHLLPEQVQIFTPTPSTWSSAMYHTGLDPFSGDPLFVEKTVKGKERQKEMLTLKPAAKKWKTP